MPKGEALAVDVAVGEGVAKGWDAESGGVRGHVEAVGQELGAPPSAVRVQPESEIAAGGRN